MHMPIFNRRIATRGLTDSNFKSIAVPLENSRSILSIGLRCFGRTKPIRPAEVSAHLLPGIPVHLTVDTDGFDQTIAPAVGHPMLHGLSYEDFQIILPQTAGAQCPLLSEDWTELNPAYDSPNSRSLVFVLQGLVAIAQHWEQDL